MAWPRQFDHGDQLSLNSGISDGAAADVGSSVTGLYANILF